MNVNRFISDCKSTKNIPFYQIFCKNICVYQKKAVPLSSISLINDFVALQLV